MNIVLHSISEDEAGKRLKRVMEMLMPRENIEACSTFNALSLRLHQPLDNVRQVLLNASSKKDLIDIISLRDILCNVRVVLVLTDRDAATTSMGHLLQPRLISYTDSDFIEVFAVLSRMIVAADIVRDTRNHIEYTITTLESIHYISQLIVASLREKQCVA